MARKRLTRREIIQEDRIHATLAGIYERFLRHQKLVVTVLTVVALTLAGAYFWRNYRQTHQAQLQKEFGDVLQIHHAGLASEKTEAEGNQAPGSKYRFQSAEERHRKALAAFSALAEKAPQSRLGLLARYYVALNHRELGELEEAKKNLQWVIENTHQPDIQTLARSALAQLAQMQNHPAEAIELFKQIVDSPTPHFPKQMALWHLARSYEAQGNMEEALRQYRKLNSEYPLSPYARQAQAKISELEVNRQDAKDAK